MRVSEASKRALVMGILNVTPDSFSDAGRWSDATSAIDHGLEMAAEGADIVDVGGESTRPGAEPVPAEEQIRRALPVVEALAREVRVSIDTRSADVARAAIAAGATLVNDVSASLAAVAAAEGVGWVAMHMQGEPQTMQNAPRYDDVVSEVVSFLGDRAERADTAGVKEVWLDPGIGFGKTTEHNLALVRGIGEVVSLGRPVVVGTSRKGFLGVVTARGGDTPGPEDRLEGSIATAVWSVLRGARMVRVHDVAPTVQALRLIDEPVEEAVA
ncbi:MAG: dihydropteroate synthase [Actinobacteria bacterium]|nr:dihydropteroate synthase [Actinomycetota bacterium]